MLLAIIQTILMLLLLLVFGFWVYQLRKSWVQLKCETDCLRAINDVESLMESARSQARGKRMNLPGFFGDSVT